jgi:hypothetical protein
MAIGATALMDRLPGSMLDYRTVGMDQSSDLQRLAQDLSRGMAVSIDQATRTIRRAMGMGDPEARP